MCRSNIFHNTLITLNLKVFICAFKSILNFSQTGLKKTFVVYTDSLYDEILSKRIPARGINFFTVLTEGF